MLTLAVGIAANTAIFSVVNGVLCVRRLPARRIRYSVPRASEQWKVVTTLAPQRRGITSKTDTAQFPLATAQFLLSLDEKAPLPWVLE